MCALEERHAAEPESLDGSRQILDMQIASALPSETLLARLRERGEDWHESHLPERVRSDGFHGVKIVVDGRVFRIQFEGGPRNTYYPRLDGRVSDAPLGCMILASFHPSLLTSVAVSVMIASVALIAWQTGSLFFVTFALILIGAMYTWCNRRARSWREGLLEVVSLIADAGRTATADGNV